MGVFIRECHEKRSTGLIGFNALYACCIVFSQILGATIFILIVGLCEHGGKNMATLCPPFYYDIGTTANLCGP